MPIKPLAVRPGDAAALALAALLSATACASGAAQAPAAAPAPAAPVSSAPALASAPDYADGASWLCRPRRQDACAVDLATTVVRADGTMSRETFTADPAAPFDCFYVYPTVSTDPTPNSDMSPDAAELRVVAQQFARFASVCRPFAPIYRQVTLAGLGAQMRGGQPISLERGIQYDDVREAFRHYVANDNAGRGFVLVGHSQGSWILTRLVAEEIEGRPLQRQMISALLLGAAVTVRRSQDTGGSFRSIPLCRAPGQIGCVVAYSAFRVTAPPPANALFARPGDASFEAACTNPAALAGGRAEVRAYLAAGGTIMANAAARPWVTTGAAVETPYVSVPGLLSAECVADGGATYLAIRVHGDPADPRADDIVGDIAPPWGLHLLDVDLTLGDLIAVVREQGASFRLRR